jgi:hypothetical protein
VSGGRRFGRASERGVAAIELVLGVGVLLIPVALVVLTIPTWSERQTTARAIAREVARDLAGLGVCDADRASALGRTMAANLGLRAGDAQVRVDCIGGGALPPGGDLLAEVTVRMPAVHLLGIGDVGEWRWTARHRQPVDTYVGAP